MGYLLFKNRSSDLAPPTHCKNSRAKRRVESGSFSSFLLCASMLLSEASVAGEKVQLVSRKEKTCAKPHVLPEKMSFSLFKSQRNELMKGSNERKPSANWGFHVNLPNGKNTPKAHCTSNSPFLLLLQLSSAQNCKNTSRKNDLGHLSTTVTGSMASPIHFSDLLRRQPAKLHSAGLQVFQGSRALTTAVGDGRKLLQS